MSIDLATISIHVEVAQVTDYGWWVATELETGAFCGGWTKVQAIQGLFRDERIQDRLITKRVSV